MADPIDGATGQTTPPERVGFCQDCGKPLTRETIRTVGSGVFCEPCLEARVAATSGGYSAVPGAAANWGAGYAVPPQPATGAPSPAVATLLGFIPGVGAMYNGQYAKAVAHFVIFAVLSSLSDGHSLFGLLCFVWFCYMVVDAHQTAKARRDGTPLPNPFGLNDIGDRMGFGRNWPGSASRPAAGQPPAAAPSAAASAGATPWTPATPPPPVAPAPPVNWAGYVHPAAFTPPPPLVPVPEPASWGSTPHQAAYTAAYVPVEPVAAAVPLTPSRKFPLGAIWLIGLGVLFLLVNLVPDMRMNGLWMTSILLAGVASWAIMRRIGKPSAGLADQISCLRFPIILLVLAVLFALYAAGIKTLGQTWPVLFIVFGGLLLVERMVQHAYPLPPVPPAYVPAPPGYAAATEPQRAAWTGTDGPPKDGQL